MLSIPEDIYIEILLRVPAKSILIWKCVCKNWYALISSPVFVKLHLNREKKTKLLVKNYYKTSIPKRIYICKSTSLDSLISKDAVDGVEIDYPFKYFVEHDRRFDVRFVASCNGLVVCLSYTYDYHRHVCIWNPVTREYKKVPASPYKSLAGHDGCTYDFYYDSKTDDYKLLQIVSDDIDHDTNSLFHIYTLGTNSWKSIETSFPCWIQDPIVSGVLVNGALHWRGKQFINFSSWVIFSMEISNEKFKKLQLPKEHCGNENNMSLNIGVLEECLCGLIADFNNACVELWVMQDYGIEESWTKRYVITHEEIGMSPWLRMMWSFKNGEMLFKLPDGKIVLYNPKNGSVRVPNMYNLPFDAEEIYFESLVSLHSGTYEGGIEEIRESTNTWI